MIRLLLRPIRLRRARAAYNAAPETQEVNRANRRAYEALHARMAAEQGREWPPKGRAALMAVEQGR
jgi:hypothetical protein